MEKEKPSPLSEAAGSEQLHDLTSFREEWKKELGLEEKERSGPDEEVEEGEGKTPAETDEPYQEVEDSRNKQARELFLQGVHLEQTGRLYEAIRYYKRAVQLVPDIEYRAFQYTTAIRAKEGRTDNIGPAGTGGEMGQEKDENGNRNMPEEEDEPELANLTLKFSRLGTHYNGPLVQAAVPSLQTHIGQLPSEVLNYILKWVVSSELDVKSLESCSEVCRGFYLAARDQEIWRLMCLKVWGASVTSTNYQNQPWRDLFISRPRVNFHGCYSSKMSYIREGERGFQDHESYKSWHIVQYFRFLRLFPGGRAIMTISADDPGLTAKLMNNRNFCSVQGSMIGDYRIVDNVLVCVLHKQASKKIVQPRQRKKKMEVVSYYDIPQQDFHLEFYIQGSKNKILQWKNYNIVSTFKSGREQVDSVNIADMNNFPSLTFHRVGSYHFESSHPLRL